MKKTETRKEIFCKMSFQIWMDLKKYMQKQCKDERMQEDYTLHLLCIFEHVDGVVFFRSFISVLFLYLLAPSLLEMKLYKLSP